MESAPAGGPGTSSPAGADRVLALDNVPLDLPIAGAGVRSLAASVDYLVVTGLAAALVLLALFLGSTLGLRSPWWLAGLFLGLFAVEYGYFAGSEIAMAGQTLGKRTLGLRVVTRHGSRAGIAALLVRNALRNVDVLVGIPLMILDPASRRLGDRLAGTLVVRRPDPAPAMLGRAPKGWTPSQIELLESFVARCEDLEPARRERLAESLLASIAQTDPGFLDPETAHLPPTERLKRSLVG